MRGDLPQTGGLNVRYKRGFKAQAIRDFLALLERRLPYCTVRYAF